MPPASVEAAHGAAVLLEHVADDVAVEAQGALRDTKLSPEQERCKAWLISKGLSEAEALDVLANFEVGDDDGHKDETEAVFGPKRRYWQ